MSKLTKKQIKDNQRIIAWIQDTSFKENARDKDPQIPKLSITDVLSNYTPNNLAEMGRYYTPLEMSAYLWQKARELKYVDWNEDKRILDPCGGIGHLLYPITEKIELYGSEIQSYEMDPQALSIGEKLFPEINWINQNPFDFLYLLEGYFDLVVMNPPFNITWATTSALENSVSGAKKSEHLFLELAVRALKKNGKALLIGPYNYLSRLPKGLGVQDWFDENAAILEDLGELPGEFQHTKIKMHGYIIQRYTETTQEVIQVGGDSISTANIPEEPTDEEMVEMVMEDMGATDPEKIKTGVATGDWPIRAGFVDIPDNAKKHPEQLELSLLPEKPPEPIFSGFLDVSNILDGVGEFNPGKPPDSRFILSIKRWGVREPIELNQLPNGKLRLMSGRRRLRAAQLLELETIPVRLYILDSLVESTLTIDSNVQRSDNPLSDFEAILDLKTKAKARGTIIDEKDISQATGMPVGTIRKRMKLANLPREILTAVGGKRVALGVATEIANLSTNQQNELVEILKENGKLTGKDVQSIKQVDREKAIQDIPAEVFNTPDAENHEHDFKFDTRENWFHCSGCETNLKMNNVLENLNKGNYDLPL